MEDCFSEMRVNLNQSTLLHILKTVPSNSLSRELQISLNPCIWSSQIFCSKSPAKFLNVFINARGTDHSHVLPNPSVFNLLKPTGYVMHHQLTFNNYTLCPQSQFFFIYLRTNSDLCHLHHELIGFYNRVEKCLQSGTDWVFK
jgi:hypothetical protein